MENKVSRIFDGLNAEQKNAVSCVDGPVLIVAGAGSGKTRVLTSRIAYMLELGIDPRQVMALTFTKKAASEMKERIALMVGEQKARRLVMGTFHSVFIRFLREYAEFLRYPSTFTIYDTADSLSAIKVCIKALGLDEDSYKPKTVLSRISDAKNNLVVPSSYRNNANAMQRDMAAKMPRICDIYQMYVARCRETGVMDFDDILLNMNILLRDNPDALKSISERFSHILVDEYQDTNFAQYLIIRKLAARTGNLCVVGDDSQSIYAFRGARVENILNFKKDFPNLKMFKLELNYRSTRMIVGAANSVIERNANRIKKTCESASGDDGEKIRLIRAFDENEEARLIVANILMRLSREHAQYKDFAILYRTNSQSLALEKGLRDRNIPYQIYSGHSFFDRAEVKDAMAYLKLVSNPRDDEAFKRAVNKPARGIGSTSIEALFKAAQANSTSLFKAVYSEDLEKYGLKAAGASKIRAFCDMINRYASRAADSDAYEIATSVINESGLYASFKMDPTMEGQTRAANVEELLNSVKQYVEDEDQDNMKRIEAEGGETSSLPTVTISDYLENMSLLSSIDISEDDETGNNKVSLMTVHSSKGLEFPYVFVSGMERNLFPSGNSFTSTSEIEEERRLFYVAITRAKVAVALTYSDTRMRNGKHESNEPSIFLREINPYYVENPLEESDFRKVEYDPLEAARRRQAGRNERVSYRPAAGNGPVKFIPKTPSQPAQPRTVTSRPVAQPESSQPMEKRLLRNPKTGNYVYVNMASQQPSKGAPAAFESDPLDSFKAGDRVEHDKFGAGVIRELSGRLPDIKGKISFDSYGEKIIMLKFAKLRHI